jgi:3-oxoacyl-[acyl-carrier protein] reductase/(S)-1-phenylethanol dehydrogenase
MEHLEQLHDNRGELPKGVAAGGVGTPDFVFHDLRQRVILLTGAANGIGRVLAHGLAEQGCRLILVDKDEVRLREVATSIQGLWGERNTTAVEIVVCDLSDPEARAAAMLRIHEVSPVVDGLIHNAAIDPRMPLENTSLDFFRHVMATNVEPAVEMTRDLLPQLKLSEAARIILIGSATFELGSGMLSSYVASKGAVVGLTRSLANELGKEGITVNCISPGVIDVDKEASRRKERRSEHGYEEKVFSWQAMKRVLVPADLLGIVCLLLSRAGGGITGQVLSVDGGLQHPLADPDRQAALISPCVELTVGAGK